MSHLAAAVICTRNRPDLLRGALESLDEQTLPRDQYEIVVVDNGDGSGGEIACEAGANVVLQVSEPGLSRARNAGWRAASATWIAFLDDDAVASPDWLEVGLELLERSAAVAAGGPILPFYDERPPEWFRDEYELRTWGDRDRLLLPGETFSASNLFLARATLDVVGGFDTRLGMRGSRIAVGEETALFGQLWQRPGVRAVYSPRLVVRHRVSRRKTTVGYQLRRSAAAGDAWAVQSGPPRRDVGRATRDALAAAGLAGRAVLRLRRPWQQWAIEELGPVAGRLGSLLRTLRSAPSSARTTGEVRDDRP
jgi:glycosyltransferase involved in cell wall biosynthesis